MTGRGRRIWAAAALALAAVAGGAAIAAAVLGDGSPRAEAYVAPAGSDGNPCTEDEPCRTFGRAYDVVKLGALVHVAPGTYPGEVIEGSKPPHDAPASQIVFRPSGGAVVVRGTLEVNVAHVEFREMAIERYEARYSEQSDSYRAANLVFRDVDARSCAFTSVRYVSILGGDIGPNLDPEGRGPDDGCYFGTWPAGVHPTEHVILDGVTVHDVRKPDASAHSDCVQFTAGRSVTIRNSRFHRCEHAGLMIKGDQGPIEGFVIENNVLGRTLSGFMSVNLVETEWGCRGVALRRNVAGQNIRTDSCTGAVVTHNRQPSMTTYHCTIAVARVDWNVYGTGSPCGPNDRVDTGR